MPIETRVHGAGGTVSQTAADLGAEAVAVPVRTGPVAPAAEVAAQLPFTLDELLALHKAKGEPGEITASPVRVGDP
ncbi:leucyl aminopeptidase, partial [Actinomadura sp. BRA 177]|nr:leucyl aminopeptidase [Actinomadura sp. BRA 177]